MTMTKGWKAAAAVAVTVAIAGGGVALAAGGGAPPGSPGTGAPGAFGPGRPGGASRPVLSHVAHAEATLVLGGRVHVIRIDHGIVRSVSSSAISLQEQDGTTVSVPIGADTRFFVDGRPASASDVQVGDVAFTLRDGDSPARGVRAFDPALVPQGGSPGAPAPGPTDPASAASAFPG